MRTLPAMIGLLLTGAVYASEDAFVRVFKRHVGQSPAEFRRAKGGAAPRG